MADWMNSWLRSGPAVGADWILLRRRSGAGLTPPAGHCPILDRPTHTVHTRDELLESMARADQENKVPHENE